MQFRTQEDLLRHLGKSNDRNLIKRMMERGEVWKENGMYCFDDGGEEEKVELYPHYFKTDDNVAVLKNSEEVDKLKEELSQYKEWLDQANKAYEDLEREKKAEVDGITKRCWDYMYQHKCCPTQTYKEFEYWILGKEYADIQFDPSDLPF